MGQHLLPGNPPIELTLRRSARARRISLRVSGVDGRVTLTLPHGVPEHTAIDFAHEKAPWLRRQLARHPENCVATQGALIPIEGQMHRIIPGPGRIIRAAKDSAGQPTLAIPGTAESTPRRLQAWLKTRARDRLAQASDHYAQALGRPYARLTLRDTRSRWGSCTHDGGLMFSWRLIMAPPEVLNYVAAHEVAHLAEMNHSPAFWAIVTRLFPEYETPRKWLRENGAELHRYRFEASKPD